MKELLIIAALYLAVTGGALAACPSGETELLPNLRALPPDDFSIGGPNFTPGTDLRFDATSWNAGRGALELVARAPDVQAGKQAIDQRVYCSGGSYFDQPADSADYHDGHDHVHFSDYANYILEPINGNFQNPRQGSKTSFCIMDTDAVDLQLADASEVPVFEWCPTQEPGFNTQGMSVGWGDTYGSQLVGQSVPIADLPAGTYRIRHVFDPKNLIAETREDDNESCRLVEFADVAGQRIVSDAGPCAPISDVIVNSITPGVVEWGQCVDVTIAGANLTPELRFALVEGKGPIPAISRTAFDASGHSVTAQICVPDSKGGKPDALWDLRVTNEFAGGLVTDIPGVFRVQRPPRR